jgi:hypothetical protein
MHMANKEFADLHDPQKVFITGHSPGDLNNRKREIEIVKSGKKNFQ